MREGCGESGDELVVVWKNAVVRFSVAAEFVDRSYVSERRQAECRVTA